MTDSDLAQRLRRLEDREEIRMLVALYGQTVDDREIEALGEMIVTLCTQAPRPVQESAPWVSAGLAAIVARALRLNPAERFQTAAEMLDALRAELAEEATLDESMLVRLPL